MSIKNCTFCIRATIVRLPSGRIASNDMFSCGVVMNGLFCVLCIFKLAFNVASKVFHACCFEAFGKFDKRMGWNLCRVARLPCTPATNGQTDQWLLGSE